MNCTQCVQPKPNTLGFRRSLRTLQAAGNASHLNATRCSGGKTADLCMDPVLGVVGSTNSLAQHDRQRGARTLVARIGTSAHIRRAVEVAGSCSLP